MSSIVVGFSRPKKWFVPFSWLIRLATKSKFSHTYICFYYKDYKRWVVYQASGLKVNFISKKMFSSLELVAEEFLIPINKKTKLKVIQKAIDKCGSPYGVGQIFGFSLVLFMRLFGKSIKNPFYSKSSYVCSELVGDILKEIHVKNSEKLDPSVMTPKDVYAYLKSNNYKPLPTKGVSNEHRS
jgi:hypothetical protein